jgi:hypothetical protein
VRRTSLHRALVVDLMVVRGFAQAGQPLLARAQPAGRRGAAGRVARMAEPALSLRRPTALERHIWYIAAMPERVHLWLKRILASAGRLAGTLARV